jgi:hypothetical protein
MTTEKVLAFAYDMRKFYETYLEERDTLCIPDNSEKLKKFRQILADLHPDYKSILNIISECENEIKYNQAKSKGNVNEKSRTSAALKMIKNCSKDNYKGYKRLNDETICMCDGYVLFKGREIIGIEEVPYPHDFIDVNAIIPKYNTTKQVLDINDIKAKYKLAKTEYPKSKLKQLGKSLISVTDNAIVCIETDDGQNVYFQSELIIQACDLIGGKDFTIQVDKGSRSHLKCCYIEGNSGVAVVVPFRKTT